MIFLDRPISEYLLHIRKLYKLLTLDSMDLEREEIAHNLAHRRLHIRCQTKALSRALIMLFKIL